MSNASEPAVGWVNKLPYDIIAEIFIHCVHQTSLGATQPNTEIAPMLLCQVGTTWRTVALATRSLCSHLRFQVPIMLDVDEHPYNLMPEAFICRLEWLMWWRHNLGPMAPYLQVDVPLPRRGDSRFVYRRTNQTELFFDFLFDFLSSAHHLSVARLYRYLVERRRESGGVKILPNIHTLLIKQESSTIDGDRRNRQFLDWMLPQTSSTLRRLSIAEVYRFQPQDAHSLHHTWSTLTHLEMKKLQLDANDWLPFIRSLHGLQAGVFSVVMQDDTRASDSDPVNSTLTYLSTPSVAVHPLHRHPGAPLHLAYPLSYLFKNLQLPALQSLSLDSLPSTWRNPRAIEEVNAVLLSVPSIRRLSLGLWFLGVRGFHSPIANNDLDQVDGLTAINDDVGTLSEHAPQLDHLRFHVFSPVRSGALSDVEMVFTSSRWLDLRSPTSTIRKITLVPAYLFRIRPPETITDSEYDDRSQTVVEIRKYVNEGVDVVFTEDKRAGGIANDLYRNVWDW